MKSRWSKKESKHNRMRDQVYRRLVRKNENTNALVGRELDYYDRYGKHRGCMDVCVLEQRNGVSYVDYYEIKSTKSTSCRHKAQKQAKTFYDSYRSIPDLIPRFVVSTPAGTWRIPDYINK